MDDKTWLQLQYEEPDPIPLYSASAHGFSIEVFPSRRRTGRNEIEFWLESENGRFHVRYIRKKPELYKLVRMLSGALEFLEDKW